MPELPEVETIRRQLAPAVEGRRIDAIQVLDGRWCEPAPPSSVEDAVRGRVVESLGRRGKYLIASLEDEVHLVMHLRMTGNLLLIPAGGEEPAHLRVRITLDSGSASCSPTCAASAPGWCCSERMRWASTSTPGSAWSP